MKKEIFTGNYNGIEFEYIGTGEEGELKTKLRNGVSSTHKIPNWGIVRVMQYIESMLKLV